MKKVTIGVVVTLVSTTVLAGQALAKDTAGEVGYTQGTVVLDPEVVPDPENPGVVKHSLPESLNFGSHEIQTKLDETWIATVDGDQDSEPTVGTVRIHDNRGTNAGWAITVKQLAQFTSETSKTLLNGAELTIDGSPTVTNNLSNTGITGYGKIVFDAFDDAKSVLEATEGNGAGETEFNLTNFSLFVAKNNEKVNEKYTTTLVWAITDAP